MSLLAEKTGNVSDPKHTLAEEQAEIIAGLQSDQKRISPKYFYDQRGSELFDLICDLPEYYPTRTERRIMERHLPEIADLVGPNAAVIEFGAGSNSKARQLLDHLHDPIAYVPVEISGDYAEEQAQELAADYPGLDVTPVVADFTKPFDLPEHPIIPRRNLIFFPGSTIGNFTRGEAARLLEVMQIEAHEGGALLIGVDLIKDETIIRSAYNDSQGITAEFNLNVLHHLNSGLGANFRPELFRHDAVYDREFNRIEMRLVSTRQHTVRIGNDTIAFESGEYIITEYSHKYDPDDFENLAEAAGFTVQGRWTDRENYFSVFLMSVE